MSIVKRRLDICGRERAWEYVIESAGTRHRVTARQVGRGEPTFTCSCGVCCGPDREPNFFSQPDFTPACSHIAEAQRDLSIARQAASQMIS